MSFNLSLAEFWKRLRDNISRLITPHLQELVAKGFSDSGLIVGVICLFMLCSAGLGFYRLSLKKQKNTKKLGMQAYSIRFTLFGTVLQFFALQRYSWQKIY